MREICMSGWMRGVWKRNYGRATKAPPDERGGNRHAQPNVTAPHLDSTDSRHSIARDECLFGVEPARSKRFRERSVLAPLSHSVCDRFFWPAGICGVGLSGRRGEIGNHKVAGK